MMMDAGTAPGSGGDEILQAIRRRTGHTPLVGRERELAVIAAERAVVLQGEARAVLLSGDAGSGKSRLLRAACDHFGADDGTVLVGHCLDELGMPPYLPWVDALSSRPDDSGSELDDVLSLLPGMNIADMKRGSWLDPAHRRLRIFATVSDALVQRARQRPVLLGLDDLQWSDAASNELLRYVLIHARSSRLMVIGTYRTDEASGNASFQHAMGELHRHRLLTTVPLGPLGPADMVQHIEALAGQPYPTLARAIHTHCGGNPFFAEEVLQQLADDGNLDEHATPANWWQLPMPMSVTSVITRHLDRASARCRAVLEVAGLCGTSCSIDLLIALGLHSPDEISASLDEAMAL